MITRLEVDGFKSLRDFAVDLDPFTVLVGPNSAGKSNILEALALLSRVASQSLEDAFKHGRGRSLDQFTRRGGEPGTTIRFAVEVILRGLVGAGERGDASSRYRYELVIQRQVFGSGVELLGVPEESLRAFHSMEDRARSPDLLARDDVPSSAIALLNAAVRRFHAPNIPLAARAPMRRVTLPSWDSAVDALSAELAAFRGLHLDTARLREPSERISAGTLAPDASNLPTVLASLSGPVLGEIRADLVALVPGISSFEVVPDGDSFRIDFDLSGGERIPARLASDGTLRLLALLTALRVEPCPSVLAIEEPENGVYPGRLRALLDYLREATQRPHAEPAGDVETGEPSSADAADQPRSMSSPQVLLTSHSPVVLAALRAAPQHLRFIDLVRRDGQLVTRARPVAQAAGPDRGRSTISLREIDALLHAAESEAAE
jgi:energy-coupling factor transporter ATP-binding protein EcfA2